MKQKDIALVATFVFVAAIISFILSGIVFKTSADKTKATVVAPIDSNFPDAKNDSNYSSFINTNAKDWTQPVQIGNSNNGTPFR